MNKVRRLTPVAKIVLDVLVLIAAYFFSYLIRFEGHLTAEQTGMLLRTLPAVLVVHIVSLWLWQIHRSAWCFVSLLEARRIFLGLLSAAAVLLVGSAAGLFHFVIPGMQYGNPPRGVLLIYLLINLISLIGIRIMVRGFCEYRKSHRATKGENETTPTLLVGAGWVGSHVAKTISRYPEMGIDIIGFLDDDSAKRGSEIHGKRVLGSINELPDVLKTRKVSQVLVTLSKATPDQLRRILDLCSECKIVAKVIPGFRQLIAGNIDSSHIRPVKIEDLLRRDPVELDADAIAGFVLGRVALVTGAGGSIGSELCRTICQYGPSRVLLVEQAENSLFHIHRELAKTYPDIEVIPLVADICDEARIEEIFSTFSPDMVLHAAAHKHVPLMEWNPGEAVKNNIAGTRTIADLAHLYGVSEFVMISTDKAVNPTSVMGVSKRVAEMYIQALSQHSKTRFVTVRFGNVLGSAGSVVPIFKEQIAKGGPVMVTHPDMRRYFMTIPEACQLVLQAATMGKGGEIFILDMGEPVKIVDLARDMIRLYGYSLDDIKIQYCGIRPGEKLYEELAVKEEIAKKTNHPKIFIGKFRACSWQAINWRVSELQVLADSYRNGEIRLKLKEIVPEFKFDSSPIRDAAESLRQDPVHSLPMPRTNRWINGVDRRAHVRNGAGARKPTNGHVIRQGGHHKNGSK